MFIVEVVHVKVSIVELVNVEFSEVKLFKLKLFISCEEVDEDLINLLLPESYFIKFDSLKDFKDLTESLISSAFASTYFLFAISVSLVGVVEIVPVVKSTFLIPFTVEIILAFISAFASLIELLISSTFVLIELSISVLVSLIVFFISTVALLI